MTPISPKKLLLGAGALLVLILGVALYTGSGEKRFGGVWANGPGGTAVASPYTIVSPTGTSAATTTRFFGTVSPQINGLYDLGESTFHWKKIWVDDCAGCGASGTQNLQQVTDDGNVTTNAIQFAGGTSTGAFTFSSSLTVSGLTSLQGLTWTNATGTNTTSTNLFATNGTFTNLTVTNPVTFSGLIWTNATGTNTTSTNLFANHLTVSSGSGATTTLFLGTGTSPGCIAMHDLGGSGITYLTASSGILYASTTTCQ